jgi:protein tyrosine/serine phosphatase
MAKFKSRVQAVALSVALLSTAVSGYLGYQHVSGNIHEVEPSVLYRSGQLDGGALQDFVVRKNIRTIVNLRGAHPDKQWYALEQSIAEGNGIDYVPLSLSARSEPDMVTMMRLATILRDAPKPILVHCHGGADRAGLASAIYELVSGGKSVDEAAEQLSLAYGHFPWLGSRTGAMDRAFRSFAVAWNARLEDTVAVAQNEVERTQ